jgi:chromosome segregation ATPase
MRLAKQLLCTVGLLSIGFGVSMTAQGSKPQEPDVLSALLTEVRGLRQAMEQMAAAGPRVQLALGRLQLQEQRVNTMVRRVESLRDSIAVAEKEREALQSRLTMTQNTVKQQLRDFPAGTTEADHPMGPVLAGLRREIARAGDDVQRLQAEEAQVQQQISSEQARWADINRTLEELERALGKR